jgi:lipoprotein-anchoring transpeptidase ErfK/SrfK
VQAGENLFRIAQRYGLSVDALARANNISNPQLIYAGQVLTLPLAIGGGAQSLAPSVDMPTAPPPTTENTSPEPPEPAPVVENAPLTRTHVVQANDSLSNIARQYGVSWVTLAQVNNIRNANLIYAGQVLTIPNATLQPPADYGVAPNTPNPNRWILVELSQQRLTAYENGVAIRSISVSTGLPGTPTVIGDFNIYTKLPEQAMSGPGYYLPGVPYVMYFYRGYAIHGTYWHNNFGQPMSHGCVNLPTAEAEWLYNFAEIGTAVRVKP